MVLLKVLNFLLITPLHSFLKLIFYFSTSGYIQYFPLLVSDVQKNDLKIIYFPFKNLSFLNISQVLYIPQLAFTTVEKTIIAFIFMCIQFALHHIISFISCVFWILSSQITVSEKKKM